jgi:hypothetical protein
MKKSILATAAAAATLAMAGSASAAVTMTGAVANQLYTLNSGSMLENFDDVDSPLTTFTGNLRGPYASVYNVSDSAPPPYTGPGAITACCQGGGNYSADPTRYASVQANQTATFATVGPYYLTSFSFYIGSPDEYNHVTFNFVGGGSQTFDGNEIWGGPVFNGDRTKGYRVYYDFGGAKVSSVTFSTESTNAFEFDGLAGSVAVPEPGTWALMILGFGGAGAALRSNRRRVAAI